MLLRLTYEDGGVVSVPVEAIGALGCHDDGERHFTAAVPEAVGRSLAAVELLAVDSAGAVRTLDLQARPAGQIRFASALAPRVDVEGAHCVLRWDAGAWPKAGLVHVGDDGRRTTLALGATGGELRLQASGVPYGGSFEVQLTAGLDGDVVSLPR